MATLEQQRAAFALSKVEEIQGDASRSNSKYKTQLVKLPSRLHNNGLGPTAAFLLSKGKPENDVYDWLQEWLRAGHQTLYRANEKLIDCITGRSSSLRPDEVESLYRRASSEARSLAIWLKRFAEAFLEGDLE